MPCAGTRVETRVAERSVTEVLHDIVRNVQDIIRSEVRLARAELKYEARTATRATVTLLLGWVLGTYAIGSLLFGLLCGLAMILASWGLASLIVGAGSAVNGQLIGKAYENAALKIAAGSYPGCLRYVSGHNFVQGPAGAMAQHGDFLFEVANVPGRSSMLFHGGNKAKHSRGCVLLGAVGKDPKTHHGVLSPEHPLRKLRLLFYGNDSPNASPAKSITIRVIDAHASHR